MENPIKNSDNITFVDTFLYSIVKPLDDVFLKLNFTPNLITSISIHYRKVV